jgi:hypothetical protein
MKRNINMPASLAPRLILREIAAAYTSVSPTTFDAMVDAGIMPPARKVFGRRKAWDVRQLNIAIDALPAVGDAEIAACDTSWDD